MRNLAFIFLITTSLFSSEYAVVVSEKSAIATLSVKQIKDIFILKKQFVDDEIVVPVNISSASPMRDTFEKKILQIEREQLSNYWVKQHFHGIRPPVVQSSENSMKLFVKNVNGAIGYLPIGLIDKDMRIVYEF